MSPQIFGVNWADDDALDRVGYTVQRWGGNSVTRYSWDTDVTNRGPDWFFLNIPDNVASPAALPFGSSSDRFIDSAAAAAEVVLQVPLIGWVPKNAKTDRAKYWGFSVDKYGPQTATECSASGYPSWCTADAGNGITGYDGGGRPQYVTGNDPADTSRRVDAGYIKDWMQHIAGRVGTAAEGGVKLYDLDNEPFLWADTHRDVEPRPLSAGDLWSRSVEYGAAIKTQDPDALLLGPVVWGWCTFFYSRGKDDCGPGDDFNGVQGGLPFLAWYLKKAQEYADAHSGRRLIDYLDVHYYPQASGVALAGEGSAATQALRLRSIKSLYDPTYVDESWTSDLGLGPVNLIPRLRNWIDTHHPGTKIAITEYNFGDDGPSSALAQSEVLAVFTREGVDLATRWVAPETGLMEDAFSIYLDYDGAGSRVTGDSVRATSNNVDQVGAYAVSGNGKLFVLLFNKHTATRSVAVTIPGLSGAVSLFRFSGSQRLGPAGSTSLSAGAVTLSLPA